MILAEKSNTPAVGERLLVVKNEIVRPLLYMYSIESMGDITVRAKAEKRAFAHGATLSGDGYIDSKKIKIGLDVKGATQQEHDRAVNDVMDLFFGRNYKLVNERTDSYYNIASLEKISQKWHKGYKNRWSELDITLLLTDPFRYRNRRMLVRVEFAERNTKEVVLSNSSTDTPLQFQFIPTAAMPKISVKHDQTGNSFTVSDSLLTAPRTLIVDTRTGRVLRNNIDNALNAFDGSFLSAKAGVNTYKITADAGIVNIVYEERFLL